MSTKPHSCHWVYWTLFAALAACSSETAATDSESDEPAVADTTAEDADTDTFPDDAQTPVIPAVNGNTAAGNVTTYGSVSDPAPSRGGACNYGATQIYNFAAINVNLAAGDGLGQWNGGRICGQCAEVTVHTQEGDKTTVVRITDKCPDEYCGIDLGGLPAQTLMGTQPGRYDGIWEFIPCDSHDQVSDGRPSIFVKEGSNPWWAVIQVRNPPAAVLAITWTSPSGGSGALEYASEAENFYSVPEAIRTSDERITFAFSFDFNITLTAEITGTDLTVENATYELSR